MTRFSTSFRGGASASLSLRLFLLQGIALTTVLGHLRRGHLHHGHDHDRDHGHDHGQDHGHHHHGHNHHHRRTSALESHFAPHDHEHEGGDHEHADVFDSCFVACYEDIAERYGAEFADRMREDGFTFKECAEDGDSTTSAADYANGTASDQQRALHRVLGATNQLHRLWTVPEYRGSDGRLHIPFAIKNSDWFDEETYETIKMAMDHIERSTGVLRFVPRRWEIEYIYFNHERHYERACAANLGKQTNTRTNVYLGWCRGRKHLGNIVHEMLHALGFWHEHSRPDRDDHVYINVDAVVASARGNFHKATMVNSLGSPYDFNSIMQYPPVSFSSDGRTPTILPRTPLERWETMGQRVKLSDHDVKQLRLLYQCASGPRGGDGGDIGVDDLCSTDCPCWELAPGECHDDDDECMGDLVCRETPDPFPEEEHEDVLPYYVSAFGSFSCNDYCHVNCCRYPNSKIRCPETCDSAPPAKVLDVLPERMCVRDYDGSGGERSGGGGGTGATAAATTTTTRTTTYPYNPQVPWYVKWGIDKCVQYCNGPPPCGGFENNVPEWHLSVRECCGKRLPYKEFDDCHTMPAGFFGTSPPTGSPTEGHTDAPTDAPSAPGTTSPPSRDPSGSPSPSPTRPPTRAPATESPTRSPSSSPTKEPITEQPTAPPTSGAPTHTPSTNPSEGPTATVRPSAEPTEGPSPGPTARPTDLPSRDPTWRPTKMPSWNPTEWPSGSPAIATLSGEWYVDWDLNKCVRDCLGAPPCRERRKESWERGFSTVQGCCHTMSYKPFKECSHEPLIETRTSGTRDNKWYPETSECKNDGNAPSWQRNKYDAQSTCCRSHFNWDFDNCMGITPEPSRKWFIDWAKGKCVRDCDEGEGGSCGGKAPGSWTVTHDSAGACCGAHMSYAPVSECTFNG